MEFLFFYLFERKKITITWHRCLYLRFQDLIIRFRNFNGQHLCTGLFRLAWLCSPLVTKLRDDCIRKTVRWKASSRCAWHIQECVCRWNIALRYCSSWRRHHRSLSLAELSLIPCDNRNAINELPQFRKLQEEYA